MIRSTALAALIGLLAIAPARGQEGEPAKVEKAEHRGPDVKVVFYYKRSDPAGTLKTQAYDLRKKQYDAEKVEAWLAMMARDYPGHAAYVRSVDLDREPGATEAEKLAGFKGRELRTILGRPRAAPAATAADFERALSLFRRANEGPGPSVRLHGLPDLRRPVGAANFRGGMYGPSQPSFPNPYPYPRPHP